MMKWVALECSNGADINLHNSAYLVLPLRIRLTLRHTRGVFDDQKFLDSHGLLIRSMWIIYRRIEYNTVIGYLIILVKLIKDFIGSIALRNINPEIIPDKCPINDAWGTRSCMMTSSAHGAILFGTEKKPKSSEMPDNLDLHQIIH